MEAVLVKGIQTPGLESGLEVTTPLAQFVRSPRRERRDRRLRRSHLVVVQQQRPKQRKRLPEVETTANGW